MSEPNEHIYCRTNEWFEQQKCIKLGLATNIKDRAATYLTSEPFPGRFVLVLEVEPRKSRKIERKLQKHFTKEHVNMGGGTEFYKTSIVSEIIPYLQRKQIWYRELSRDEIEAFKHTVRKPSVKDYNDSTSSDEDEVNTVDKTPKYIWKNIGYQKRIIAEGGCRLRNHRRLYLELPTGGGKSFIVYNLMSSIQAKTIIIVSPRKIVNRQNTSSKYLQVLEANGKYDVYDVSNPQIQFDDFISRPYNKIIIGCTQSIDKIYELIMTYNIVGISVWFDEAHWGVEEWCDNENKKYWLQSPEIENRIFTSASPNKPKIAENPHIFGELYSPVKVKELIDMGWLVPIKPYIYAERINSPNAIKNILAMFAEHGRNYGFSFHNKQKNAFSLFHKHYMEYMTNTTAVKPFLLVGSDYNIQEEPLLASIELDYDYRNINKFETTTNSMGYVVAQYSMGYDFTKIDYICISDPKMSIQDIIQCIGRGIRPDRLGENGQNRDKHLIISLPVYIDFTEECKYDRIVEVIRYLLHDIEIPIDEIVFGEYRGVSGDAPGAVEKYDGDENIKSILLDLLGEQLSRGITYETARSIIAEKHIKSKDQYYDLCERDRRLSLEPDIKFKGQFTGWLSYLSIKNEYYDLATCRVKVGEYLSTHADIKSYINPSDTVKQLCDRDPMFPPNDLWVEYYGVSNLRDIIPDVKRKKKISGII